MNARFSPERSPQWVAYQSDESGRNEIYVQAFPVPGSNFRITTDGGTWPQWNPAAAKAGERELYYVARSGALMSVKLRTTRDSIQPSAPVELFLMPPGKREFQVGPDGNRFLVEAPIRSGPSPLNLIVNWQKLLK